MDEAKDHAEDVRYETKRSGLDHGSGLEAVYANVLELFEMIEKKCAEINSLGSMCIDVASKVAQHTVEQFCTMTSNHVSRTSFTTSPMRARLNARLRVLNFEVLSSPNEPRQMMYVNNPEVPRQQPYI
jgi:hypothetical protein